MNKKQIIAELRRSAMEDESPWHFIGEGAFGDAVIFAGGEGSIFGLGPDNQRTFFLLVAHALEDEQ